MSKVMTLACLSGAYDCHTPPSQTHLLLPSVQEQLVNLKVELEEKQELRALLKANPERFTNRRLGHEYRQLGAQIHSLHLQITELNRHFKQQTDESFESMFVRAARNTLHPDEFNRLKRYAFRLLDEFRENTHLGSLHECE